EVGRRGGIAGHGDEIASTERGLRDCEAQRVVAEQALLGDRDAVGARVQRVRIAERGHDAGAKVELADAFAVGGRGAPAISEAHAGGEAERGGVGVAAGAAAPSTPSRSSMLDAVRPKLAHFAASHDTPATSASALRCAKGAGSAARCASADATSGVKVDAPAVTLCRPALRRRLR